MSFWNKAKEIGADIGKHAAKDLKETGSLPFKLQNMSDKEVLEMKRVGGLYGIKKKLVESELEKRGLG